jgi:Fe-S-cluster containining protein
LVCKGTCLRIRDAKSPNGRFSYDNGGKYCSTCESTFMTTEKNCKCCGACLRYTRSDTNYKPIEKPKYRKPTAFITSQQLRNERQRRYYLKHKDRDVELYRRRCLAYYYRTRKLKRERKTK